MENGELSFKLYPSVGVEKFFFVLNTRKPTVRDCASGHGAVDPPNVELQAGVE